MVWYIIAACVFGAGIGSGISILILRARNAARQADYSARLEMLTAQVEEQRRLLNPQDGQLKKTLSDLLGSDFERLANRVIDNKTQRFSEQSDRSLRQLLEPFREQISIFRKQHEEQSIRTTKEQQQLLDHITHMQNMNSQLSKQADELTRALRGDSKVQGNWGEMSLQRLLEKSGLREGLEYKTQVHIRQSGDDGKSASYADVVLLLPRERVVIFDAKVSLTAYAQFYAAKDEEERQAAAKEHARSIRNHIKTLGAKRYQYHWKREHPQSNIEDLVYMYVPIEGAVELAHITDPDLISYAEKEKVLLTSTITVIMILQVLKNMWRVDQQHKNIEGIYIEAGKIHDKCANFLESMDKVGDRLQQTNKEYEKAHKQLHSGRGNLIQSAQKLHELGAHVNKELPDTTKTDLL